jgi:hypothetical protein
MATQAERVKEQGNVAFKAKKYIEAIELYTKAIGAFAFASLHFIFSRTCVQLYS